MRQRLKFKVDEADEADVGLKIERKHRVSKLNFLLNLEFVTFTHLLKYLSCEQNRVKQCDQFW